jgi:hypothetical protein
MIEDQIPTENTVEMTRDQARAFIDDPGSEALAAKLDQLTTALDYAQGEFDKETGCKYVLIKIV